LCQALDDTTVGELVAAWGARAVRAAEQPGTGSIHQTRIVPTDAGAVVLRAYRYAQRGPVEREHALIAHARARGLPAVAPLPLRDGATILERAGRYYALFPHAPGRQLARADLRAPEASAMGRCLAAMHQALVDLPAGLLAPRPLAIDRATTLAEIKRLTARARASGHPHDPVALGCLAGQRAFVESLPEGATADLSRLAFQPIHGDYTETNLFFEHGAVCAIIDWDQAYLAPPAWEVVRTLHLAFAFDATLAGPFLAAYREVRPLPGWELDCAAAAYGLMRAHDLWLYQWIYDRGDDRARRFVTERGFVPVAAQWATLRDRLPD
jgi:homoserine kinase type II